LETIEVANEKHISVPKSITKSSNRRSLRSVNLSSNQLATIDAKFWLNTNLEKVDLSNNQKLTKIPADVGKLTKLKTFNVSHTAITALPSQLWSLKSIEVLDLSHCKLKKLDDGIGNYLQLNTLNISNNQIKVLPDSLSKCVKLRTLDISSNQISILPAGYEKLDNLETIRCSSNEFEHLPKSVLDAMTKLAVLHVDETQTEDKAELIDFEWKGVAAYTTKYFSAEEVEEVTIAEVQEDVHHAAPEQNQNKPKPVAPKRGSSKLTQQATIESAPPVTSSSSSDEQNTVDQPESGLGISIEVDKEDDHFEVVTEEDVKEATEEMNEAAVDTTTTEQKYIPVIGHDVHLVFDKDEKKEKSESDETTAQTEEEQVPDETTEPVEEDEKKEAKIEEENEVVEEVQESTLVEETPQVNSEVIEKAATEEAEAEISAETVVENEKKEESVETTEPEVDSQSETVKESSLTESEVAKAVIAQALENYEDEEEDNKPAPRPVKDHTEKVEIVMKDHNVLCKRTSSVRDAAKMFQNVAAESAKDKPSTPQSVRKMPHRQSIQTDQPSQRQSGVVRVAVPIPENYKESKVKPQVIPPAPKSIFSDKYADKDLRKSTYDNMINVVVKSTTATLPPPPPTVEAKVEPPKVEESQYAFEGQFQQTSSAKREHLTSVESQSSFDKPSIAPKPASTLTPTAAEESSITPELNKMSFASIIANLDFDLEPKTFTSKAQKASNQASLGLSIIDGEKVRPNAVFVTELKQTETKWTGDDLPRSGDVLVSLDGTEVTRENVDRLMMDTGNTINITFYRFPGSFTGCE